MTDPQLDIAGVAAHLGIARGTWITHRNRATTAKHPAPKPDGHIGRSPWWYTSTIDAWQTARPGVAGRPKQDG